MLLAGPTRYTTASHHDLSNPSNQRIPRGGNTENAISRPEQGKGILSKYPTKTK